MNKPIATADITVLKVEDQASTSLLGRKILSGQSREIIYNVYSFMKREAELEGPILLKQVQRRLSEATGVSRSTIQRILKESRKTPQSQRPSFSTPRRKWAKKKRKKTEIDDFDKTLVRRTIYDFYRNENQLPTLNSLLPILKDSIGFQGSTWALRQVLKQLKFKWKKTQDNRNLLFEKKGIRKQRTNYIRAVRKYREEGRAIVYTDETYIHPSLTQPHSSTDVSNVELLQQMSKGQCAIIFHAGTDLGFVKGAELVLKSGQLCGDFHESTNFTNFDKWLVEQLIAKLPPRSVVVVDDAMSQNKEINKTPAPTSKSKVADMTEWLLKNNIPFSENMAKPELYQIINVHKNTNRDHQLDTLFAEHGHSILRLPPFHPDLNAMKMMWALIKNHVASKNRPTTLLNDCILLVHEQINNEIGAEDWKEVCEHVIKNEEDYMESEKAIESLAARIVMDLGDDGSESEWDESDDNQSSCQDNEGEGEMSGVADSSN